MIITWIGHSCFKLEEKDYAVILDPYGEGTVPGLKPVNDEANLVICSHGHFDHAAVEEVNVIPYEGEAPIWVERTIHSFHDPEGGSLRGENDINILRTKNIRLAHFGDIGCELKEEEKELLKNLDIALIPIGGHYTIDSKEAYKLAQEIKPKKIIPMHYRAQGFGFDVISTADEFSELSGRVTSLEFSSIEGEEDFDTQVIFLKPRNLG